jgi:hypothetical protein
MIRAPLAFQHAFAFAIAVERSEHLLAAPTDVQDSSPLQNNNSLDWVPPPMEECGCPLHLQAKLQISRLDSGCSNMDQAKRLL